METDRLQPLVHLQFFYQGFEEHLREINDGI